MIKIRAYIYVLFLVLTSSILIGQTYIGVIAGMNNSKLSGDAPVHAKYGSLIGANFAAFIDVKLTPSVYLSFQPSYSQEGTRVSYKLPGLEDYVDSIKVRLNYFSVPFLFKITSNNKRYYAISGIETALLLNSSLSIDDRKKDINASIAQWNLAMHFGAGIIIPVGFPSLFIEVRYTQGLVNITDEAQSESVIPRVKTSGIIIMAGIKIPLTKSNK